MKRRMGTKDNIDTQMRELEYFHTLRVLPGTWVVVRVDGRGFSRLTEALFEKPFDIGFHDLMVRTARTLLEEMQGIYAYTESDEISVLFRPAWDLYDRELEKIVSISSSIAGATFSQACQTAGYFDSRAWLGADAARVVDYFRWRQADATRCALNGWCYWTLRKAGQSAAQATAALVRQTVAAKNELLFQHGINFNNLPTWQRRGAGLYWETYEKEGYDPIHAQKVVTTRRRIAVDENLPMRGEYSAYIHRLLDDSQVALGA